MGVVEEAASVWGAFGYRGLALGTLAHRELSLLESSPREVRLGAVPDAYFHLLNNIEQVMTSDGKCYQTWRAMAQYLNTTECTLPDLEDRKSVV